MTTEMGNPPAFPNQPCGPDGMPTEEMQAGMSLRDWFAGQALAGLLANEAGIEPYPNDWAAERAYLLADAMLAARHPTQEQTI